MKVLFTGLGSIGQRHLRNSKSVLGDTAEFMAFRTSKSQSIIEDGEMRCCEDVAGYYGFTEFRNFEKALEQQPDVGFVCNPSKYHVETAIAFARAGICIFIEKPLATDIARLDELEKLVSEKQLVAMVGFQSRFHPCVRKIQQILTEGFLGEVVSAQFNWSTFLPGHHKYEDYRKGYAARNDLGGGVTNCLSHELDIIQHFFGKPISVYAVEGGCSDLQMDAEDTVVSIFRCDDGEKNFPVSLHVSFAQKLEERAFTILMQKGCVKCDLHNNKIKVLDQQGQIVFQKTLGLLHRNELFLQEVQHFFDCVSKGCETDIGLSEGRKSVLMALAIHESIQSGKVEVI